MGFRFQKRIKIAPGLRLNISKSGFSTTVGAKGASVNIGKNGTYANVGLPGSGLSFREKINSKNDNSAGKVLNTVNESYSESNMVNLPKTKITSYFVFIGTLVVGTAFCLPAIYCYYKAFKRFFAKTKPVYGEKPVFKSDRRYKSGQKASGYSLEIIGHEPMNSAEIAATKKLGINRFIIGSLLLAINIWLIVVALNSPEFQ